MAADPIASIRGYAYRVFYGVPPRWRRRLIRLAAPTYTIGAVLLVHEQGDGPPESLLLVRQPPGRAWSLPAGLLKRGEAPHLGAARELREETGLDVSQADLRPANPTAVVHTRGQWIDVVFTVRVPATAALHADGGEILEVGWHRLDAMPRLTPATAALLRQYGLGPATDTAAGTAS